MGNQIIAADGSVKMLWPCLSVIGAQTLCYTYCQIKKDNSYIDVMWGLTFIIPNMLILGAKLALKQPIDARTWALNGCLSLWAVRLAWHIGKRHTEEDYRYQSIRKRLSQKGQLCYYIQAFFYIFMLQAVLSLGVNYTVMRTTAMSSQQTFAAGGNAFSSFKWSDYVGFSAFLVGFLFEVVGDA